MVEAEWLTSRNLSKETGIAESTIRRYIDIYGSFFVSRQLGRKTVYAPGAAVVLKRIKELHDTGRGSEEVRAILEQEHTQTLPIVTTNPPLQNESDMPALIKEQRDFMARITATAQDIATTLPKIQENIETVSKDAATAYQDMTTRMDRMEHDRQADTRKTNMVIVACFAIFILVIVVLFLLR
jgi:DNA-binding transcriptional MerR regulator